MSKITHESSQGFQILDSEGHVIISYIPRLNYDFQTFVEALKAQAFTRVEYISQYGKANRTPRLTWAWAYVEGSNIVEPINCRGLNFYPERMPPYLESLSAYIRATAIHNYEFDPMYNSCIIGRYDSGEDQIGFHRDDETFLEHLFCANVTVGYSRDFQFRIDFPDVLARNGGKPETHEISLDHASVLFFSGVEHALPKRAAHKNQGVRYSISFRRMKNNIGVGNTMYYCRGLAGAINDQSKQTYETKLRNLQNGANK